MTKTLIDQAMLVFEAGLAAADPGERLAEIELPAPAPGGRLVLLGAGKAAAHLARSVDQRLSGRPYTGRVIVKHGHGLNLPRLSVDEAGHPLPDEAGARATRRLLDDIEGLTEADRVLFLLTGGASSLLVAPADGLSLSDKIAVTDLLLRCGATIQELNTVRKHLSKVKGGRLLQRLAPARVLALIISDVIGDDLSSIGSGPTTADPTTFGDALEILRRFSIDDSVPPSVLDHLRRGAKGELSETPSAGDPVLGYAEHVILAKNRDAVDAAAAKARALGFRVEIFAYDLVGDVHEQARAFAKALLNAAAGGSPVALLAGGELTIEVTGTGKGGRAQEFALVAGRELTEGVAGRELAGAKDVLVLAAGTDGTDGPTDAAGAFADGDMWTRATSSGLDPSALLEDNDAYRFFDRMKGLVKTGPTGTNVNDLFVGLSASGRGRPI